MHRDISDISCRAGSPHFFTFPQTPFLILGKFIHKTSTSRETNYAGSEPIPLHNKLFYWSGNNYHGHIIKYLEQIGRSGYRFSRALLHFSLYDCCTELDDMGSAPHCFWGCVGMPVWSSFNLFLFFLKLVSKWFLPSIFKVILFSKCTFGLCAGFSTPFSFAPVMNAKMHLYYSVKAGYFYFSCSYFCRIHFLKAELLFLGLLLLVFPSLPLSLALFSF